MNALEGWWVMHWGGTPTTAPTGEACHRPYDRRTTRVGMGGDPYARTELRGLWDGEMMVGGRGGPLLSIQADLQAVLERGA